MGLIPPHFLDSVVAIGVAAGDKTEWIASGFLLGNRDGEDPSDKQPLYTVGLVTNRHVLEGQRRIKLRFNPSGSQPAKEFDFDLFSADGKPQWYSHPELDIATAPLNFARLLSHDIPVMAFRSDVDVADIAKMIEVGLTEGDGVFALGFPLGLVGKERNYVVVRQGSIARIRDALARASRDFLIDLSIFPGSSGGPVIIRPEISALRGTKSQQTPYLIGMAQGYVPYRDVAVSPQTGSTRVIFEENSGLASVIPIDFVLETLRTHIGAVGVVEGFLRDGGQRLPPQGAPPKLS
jgi:S1-C subfamily serine protease